MRAPASSVARLAVLAAGLVLGLGGQVVAQTQRSGSDNARLMQQLQQLTSDRARLQQDNAELQRRLGEQKGMVAGAGAEQARQGARVHRLQAENERLQASEAAASAALEKSRTQLQELVGRYRELAQTLRDTESERSGLQGSLQAARTGLDSCADRNAKLYLLGVDILDRLESRGFWSAVKDREAFTRLSRTRLENLVDDYRDRLQALRLAGTPAQAATH